MQKEPKKLWRDLAILSGLGIEVGFAVGIGAVIGYYLDQHFHTQPWLLLLFTGFGIGAAIKAILREVKRIQTQEQSKDE